MTNDYKRIVTLGSECPGEGAWRIQFLSTLDYFYSWSSNPHRAPLTGYGGVRAADLHVNLNSNSNYRLVIQHNWELHHSSRSMKIAVVSPIGIELLLSLDCTHLLA